MGVLPDCNDNSKHAILSNCDACLVGSKFHAEVILIDAGLDDSCIVMCDRPIAYKCRDFSVVPVDMK